MLTAVIGLASLAIIFLEFFLPGGFMALAGGILFLVSISLGLYEDPLFGTIWTLALIILLVVTIKLALVQVKKRSTYLGKTQEGSAPYASEYIGKSARVVTDLRPSGYIEVQGLKLQAVSFGEYIKKGVTVKILGERGSHLLVR